MPAQLHSPISELMFLPACPKLSFFILITLRYVLMLTFLDQFSLVHSKPFKYVDSCLILFLEKFPLIVFLNIHSVLLFWFSSWETPYV